jgi:hypothetical protein
MGFAEALVLTSCYRFRCSTVAGIKQAGAAGKFNQSVQIEMHKLQNKKLLK